MTDLTGEQWFLPVKAVIWGAGCVQRLGRELERLGAERALLVTSSSIADRTKLVERIRDAGGGRVAGVTAGISQHTPAATVAAAAVEARRLRADALVSLGGGSVVDGTKAVAMALAEDIADPAELAPFRGVQHPERVPIPHVALPTTLSAAEFSHLVGVTLEAGPGGAPAKTGFRDPRLVPRVVLLDPTLTLNTPAWLFLSTGIRALDHAVELMLVPGYHPAIDAMSLEAIRLLFGNLPVARENPTDIDARLRCQIGAWLSFYGVGTHNLGLSHNLGRRLGASYGIPHGVTSCMTLPEVMRYRRPETNRQQARMAVAMGVEPLPVDETQQAYAASDAVRSLIRRLGLAHRLREYGVPRGDLPSIAEAAGDPATREAALRILERIY